MKNFFSKHEQIWSHLLEKFLIENFTFSANLQRPETATGGVLSKMVFLKVSQSSQENSCARVSFLIMLQASGQGCRTLAQVFSCEFCEIFKNTF